MKQKRKAYWIVAAIVAVLCGVASDATADMAYPPMWFHAWVGSWPSHTPEDQTVDFEITIYDVEPGKYVTMSGKEFEVPGFHSTYNLKRKHGEETRYVFKDRVFVKEDTGGGSPYGCRAWPTDACMISDSEECDCPAQWSCDDCDDDGLAECPGFCASSHSYFLLEECVPPGSYGYVFEANAEPEPIRLGSSSITMEDTGDPCLGSDDGCSTIAVGRAGLREALLFFALLGLGLGAFFVSRRKRDLRLRRPGEEGRSECE